MAEPFIAEIRIFPYEFAPRMWAFCGGQLMPISQNQALYAVIGTTYGGNDTTTFGLPDLKGRAPVHSGHAPGLSRSVLGEKKGASEVTFIEQNLLPHTHKAYGIRGAGSVNQPQTTVLPATDRDLNVHQYAQVQGGTSFVAMSNSALATAGQSQAHYNMQPYLAVNFCIALEGLFPSRN